MTHTQGGSHKSKSPCSILCVHHQLTDVLNQGKSKERSLSRPKGLENWETSRNSGLLDSVNWNSLNSIRLWMNVMNVIIIAYVDHFSY